MLQLVPPEQLRDGLLDWFDRWRRDLPWRRSEDPYEVLVAEVMLQQTRSEVVVSRYPGFLEAFPTLDAMAEAAVEEVEAAWSGLGYYRRARNLHRAARILARRAELPGSAAEWSELPGVGPYTSAMLASRLDGECVPVLDGNVERVLSRFLASPLPPKRAEARRGLLATAARLLDPERPGHSNQALMEVGSLVCRHRRPDCDACPLSPGCAAFRTAGLDPRDYPAAAPRRDRENVYCFTAVVREGPGLLLHRRPDDAEWLAGRWHLPTVELGRGDESLGEAAAQLGEAFGGDWECEDGAVVRHAVTYRDFYVRVAAAHWRPEAGREEPGSGSAGGELGWFAPEEIDDLPTSSLLPKSLASIPIHSGP
ncbi:MAG: A/G-specific adenine glycosylase [Acidobacteria bacterium]|nr:A/G-specific adenine glycosylase [Acidobacteriota bacterium]